MHEHDPYRSPSATLELHEPSPPLVLAGRGERLGAVLIDGLLGMLLMVPPLIALGFYVFNQPSFDALKFARSINEMGLALQLGMAFAGFLLFVALQGYPLAQYGQTWGKRWLGIRIVDMQGRKPEFARMLALRYGVVQLATQVPCLGMVFALTDMFMIFREDRRCLHDLMAGTQVVLASPPATPA